SAETNSLFAEMVAGSKHSAARCLAPALSRAVRAPRVNGAPQFRWRFLDAGNADGIVDRHRPTTAEQSRECTQSGGDGVGMEVLPRSSTSGIVRACIAGSGRTSDPGFRDPT